MINQVRFPFFDGPGPAWPLALFRILVAAHSLLHGLSVQGDFVNLYGSQGYIRTPIHAIFLWDITLWFTDLRGLLNGPYELWNLGLVWTVYGLSLVGLMVGFQTRLMAIVAWALHLLLLKSIYLFNYGIDYFATMALLFCIVAPVSKVWSVDARRSLTTVEPIPIFYQRFLQLSLCLVYFFAGLGKATGSDWHTGEAVWLALHKADFQVFSLNALREFTGLWTVMGWLVLVLELGYAGLIWHRRIGPIWLLGILAMHVGIGLLLSLPWFSLLLILLNICAFPMHLLPASRWLFGRFRSKLTAIKTSIHSDQSIIHETTHLPFSVGSAAMGLSDDTSTGNSHAH